MIKNKSYSLEEYYVGTGYRVPFSKCVSRFLPLFIFSCLLLFFSLSLFLSFFICPSLSGIKLVEAPSIYSHCMRMCILHWGSHIGQIWLNRFVCEPNTSQFMSGKSKGIKMVLNIYLEISFRTIYISEKYLSETVKHIYWNFNKNENFQLIRWIGPLRMHLL